MKRITAEEAMRLIPEGSTIGITGFIGSAFPEYMAVKIEESFLQNGYPKNITVTHSPGIGSGGGKGMDHFAHVGLLKSVIASHYNLSPKLQKMIGDNEIEAYLLPQGTISQLFREIGSGRPGVISKIGLGTFVDPRLEGGKCNGLATRDLVEFIELDGEEWLWYKTFQINIAIIRATSADENGNLTIEKETTKMDQLALAQAAKNNGGIVIAEVERVIKAGEMNPREVYVPGIMVDYVVVAPPEMHWQDFGNERYDAALSQEFRIPVGSLPALPLTERKVMARRAAMELKAGNIINLGIGVPEGVSSVAVEEGFNDKLTMTVESGHIGGVPAAGLSFGGCYNPEFVNDMTRHFDFYDGGGLDICFLGAAEVDASGAVNVSKFQRIVGPGGFINIAQSTPVAVFCGTLTAGGLKTKIEDGRLIILQEGKNKKYVDKVQQITFSGSYAFKAGQNVIYITERAVFELTEEGVMLTEIAPGIDLQTQVLDQIEFPVKVSKDLKLMDERIFLDKPMGLEI